MTPLELFAIAVLKESRDELASLDGGWIQDKAEEYGLLVRHRVTEPCGEQCRCGEFPGDCLRYSPAVEEAEKSAELTLAQIEAATIERCLEAARSAAGETYHWADIECAIRALLPLEVKTPWRAAKKEGKKFTLKGEYK